MVRIKTKFVGGSDPVKAFKDFQKRVSDGNQVVLEAAIQEGEDLTKEYIATRATDWVRETLGREGRIQTGRMYEAVAHDTSVSTPRKWVGSFGWVDERRAYFLVLEEGGTNSFTGGEIEPMYALRDAGFEVWEQVVQGIKESIKNA